jgi:hypothetical protein
MELQRLMEEPNPEGKIWHRKMEMEVLSGSSCIQHYLDHWHGRIYAWEGIGGGGHTMMMTPGVAHYPLWYSLPMAQQQYPR